MGHQRHAEDLLGRLARFVGALDDLDAAALAPAAGMDLRLDDRHRRRQAARPRRPPRRPSARPRLRGTGTPYFARMDFA